MEVIHGVTAIERSLRRPVLTIGNFDGLHRGHRTIMETVVARAQALGGESVVFTFDPHPRKVLRPENAPRLLMTLDQKLEVLAELSLDVAVVEPFDRDFAATSPEVFIRDAVHRRIQPLEVYVGYDFHFGRDREGSMRLLTEMGPHLGFAVTVIPEVTLDGRDVNSTRIRGLLAEGSVEQAGELLGRPFAVRGAVAKGDQRGRSLGFPTANLAPEGEVLPAAGVYAGHVRFVDDGDPAADVRWPAVTNVGVRPTFRGGSGATVAEAHLIDFRGDLYGRRVDLIFEHRLRAEERFPGADKLRGQIARDVAEARRWLGVA